MKTIRSIKSKFSALALFATVLLASALASNAQAADPVGDTTAIVTSTTTVFNAVATLVVAMVGFIEKVSAAAFGEFGLVLNRSQPH